MKKNLIKISILFSVIGIIFSPFLFLGKIFTDADPLIYFYPFINLVNKMGNITWMPQILGGHFSPLLSENFSINYFFNLFQKNPITAYHWMIFSYFLFGAIFCYFFARKLKFSSNIALVVSLCFILSEFCIYRGRIHSNTEVFLFLPLLFYLILKIKENKKIFIPISGIIVGICILIFNPQFILYSLLAGLLYILFLDWQDYNCAKKFWHNWAMLKSYILVGIISFPIAFPFLYKILKFAKNTGFNKGLTSSYVGNTNGISFIDLLRLLSPYLQIKGVSTQPAVLYMGTFSFLLLLVGIFYVAQKSKKTLFFTLLFFFSLIAAFNYSPIFYILSRVPFFNRFHNRTRFLFITVFSGAILIGYGLQYLLEKKQDISKLVNIVKYFVVFSIIGTIISNIVSRLWLSNIINCVQRYYQKNLYNAGSKFSLQYYFQAISFRVKNLFYLFDLANFKFLVPFIFLLIGYLMLEWYQKEGELGGNDKLKIFEILSVGIIILNFLLIYPMYHQKISQAEYLKEPNTAIFIKSREFDSFTYRIFDFELDSLIYQKIGMPSNNDIKVSFEFQKEVIQSNLNFIYDIHSLNGFDGFMSRRDSILLSNVGSDYGIVAAGGIVPQIIDGTDLSDQEKIDLFIERINILAALNVKYILTPHILNTPELDLAYETKATYLQIPVYVYEIKEFLPRIYFADNVEFIGSDIDDLESMDVLLNNADSVLDTAFVECETNCHSGLALESQEILNQAQHNIVKNDKISIIEYKAGYIEVDVDTKEERWLVFNESFYQGWKAYIDEAETDIYTANYLMQAILAPGGIHKIRFEFDEE